MDKNKFGNYIKEKRTEAGLTQNELAERLSIGVTAVSKWERGVTFPDITMIPDICKHLNINEHELIESSNDTEYRVMKEQARQFTKIKNVIFYSFSAAYAVAVLTCFIVNIAVFHTLSWFWIVAASCLCGFTFIPTITRFFTEYKLPVFIVSTYISMFLLFLISSIYTGNYWCFVAASGVLLGYFAVFYPALFYRQKYYVTEQSFKSASMLFFITYSFGLFLLTMLLLYSVSCYVPIDLELSLRITCYCFLILIIYGVIELMPLTRLFKLGIDSVLTGGYLYGLNGVLNKLLNGNANCYHIDFNNWSDYSDGNVTVIALLVFLGLGLLFFIIGLIKKRK